MRVKEHHWHICLCHQGKSAGAEQSTNLGTYIQPHTSVFWPRSRDTWTESSGKWHTDCALPSVINMDDGFSLSKSWEPPIHNLMEQKQAFNKNMTPFSGPWKGLSLLLPHSLPRPLLCNMLEDSLLVQIPFPIFLASIGPFPSAFLPQTLHKPSNSQLCQLNTEDGDNIFSEMLALTYNTT
jgi:hypothetical protein